MLDDDDDPVLVRRWFGGRGDVKDVGELVRGAGCSNVVGDVEREAVGNDVRVRCCSSGGGRERMRPGAKVGGRCAGTGSGIEGLGTVPGDTHGSCKASVKDRSAGEGG